MLIIKNVELYRGEIVMEKALKEKLETAVGLINNVMVNPDINVEYCMPEAGEDPYIQFTYGADDGTDIRKKNIPLKHHYLDKTPEDIANLVTFYIEQTIEEIDSINSGAQ